jgi:hypothetical protein
MYVKKKKTTIEIVYFYNNKKKKKKTYMHNKVKSLIICLISLVLLTFNAIIIFIVDKSGTIIIV